MPASCPSQPQSAGTPPTLKSRPAAFRPSPLVPPKETHPLNFSLFIVLNGVLFIRPGEIVPGLIGLPIYEWTILACLAVSLPSMLQQLRSTSLASQPIAVCVLGLLPVTILSFLSHFSIWGIRNEGWDFFKVILYFLLFISNVTSTRQLRHFLGWVLCFILVLCALALLHFYEVMEIPSLVRMRERQFYDSVGRAVELDRLCSTGIYDNPNSLSRILVVGMGISLYWLFDWRTVLPRLLGLVSAGIFGFAIMLTHSRGGFIALLVGTLVFFLTRFGWRKSLPLALLAFPLLFLLFAGRQTDIDPSEGTGQERIQLWNKGFSLFQGAPLLGIGMGKYEEEANLVAHNSFIHCYTELGFLGGTLFTGAIYLSLWSMYRLGLPKARIPDRELQRMRPYLMAIMAAYAAGMCTISISYHVPTYMLFGLSTVYLRLAGANLRLMPRLNGKLVFRLGTISAAVLVGFYVYVRLYI